MVVHGPLQQLIPNSPHVCRSEALSLTASLKASEVASNLQLLQAKCSSIVTRILVQRALHRLYAGNTSDANWVDASNDIAEALGTGGNFDLYQATVYSRNGQGNHHGLFNVTGANTPSIALPYSNPNGSVGGLPLKHREGEGESIAVSEANRANRKSCWGIRASDIRPCCIRILPTHRSRCRP